MHAATQRPVALTPDLPVDAQCRSVRTRQPIGAESADLETTSGTGLAAAASAATVPATAASATVPATAAADNGRRRTDFNHILDTIAEFALAAM
jgi:hypothetical protein